MYKYKEEPNISDMRGIPKDTSFDYFPKELITTSFKKKLKNANDALIDAMGQFSADSYSMLLAAFKEPLLYNYYLGYDIYRFLWDRAFHQPILITISNKNNEFVVQTKKLDKQPDSNNEVFDYSLFRLETISIRKVSIDEWLEFHKLLDDAEFWNTPPTDIDRGYDGSEWIIEGHTQNRYWFVVRWSPDKKSLLRKCGKFLINLSGIDETIY